MEGPGEGGLFLLSLTLSSSGLTGVKYLPGSDCSLLFLPRDVFYYDDLVDSNLIVPGCYGRKKDSEYSRDTLFSPIVSSTRPECWE